MSIGLVLSINDPSIVLGVPSETPEMKQPYISAGEMSGIVNFPRLYEALPSELHSDGVRAAAGCIASLQAYIDLGQSPIKAQNEHCYGELSEEGWIIFFPASCLVLRCDSVLSFDSQKFEHLGEFYEAILEKANAKLGTTEEPEGWDYYSSFSLYGFGLSAHPSIDYGFWVNLKKTREIV